MGWKGTLRSIRAAQRRAEREAQRRRRELERQRKQLEKMRELERAAYEVQVYENYIDLLLSVHKEGSDVWDWEAIRSSKPPTNVHEELAQAKLDKFKPGVFDKLLGHAESKRAELVRAVEEARQADEKEYQEALQARELADRILAGSAEAYLDAIRQTDPFSDISELGSSIEFQIENSSLVEATLHVNSEQVIPSEVKSLLKSGKLSVKQMPKSRFYELYQDYVCGCVLRVARELFALLPIEMVIVNAVGNLLNTQTGYMEEQPILSVAIPRKTLEGLNFEMLDPSDSMSNFVHRMAFRKTEGFGAVETLRPSDFQTKNVVGLPESQQAQPLQSPPLRLQSPEAQPAESEPLQSPPSQLPLSPEAERSVVFTKQQIALLAGLGLAVLCVLCFGGYIIVSEESAYGTSYTPKLTSTPNPTDTPEFFPLAVGTRVKLVGGDSALGKIAVWYMYEDRCEIDVAHSYVSSETEAIIASTKVCYAEDYDSSHRSYYYKVKIPSLDYPTENNWVNAKYVTVP